LNAHNSQGVHAGRAVEPSDQGRQPAQIPSVAERFFLSLNAEVTFYPAMNLADLKKGLDMVSTEKAFA
jgi:hypothetical protein